MESLEVRLRALPAPAMAAVAAYVLDTLRLDEPPATEDEIAAAIAADRDTLAEAARKLSLVAPEAAGSSDAAGLLAELAHASPDARAAIEAALVRLTEPQTKLPILGLGGLELILFAIAAAIARPSLDYARTPRGGTRLKVQLEGRKDLAKIIGAVLPALRSNVDHSEPDADAES